MARTLYWLRRVRRWSLAQCNASMCRWRDGCLEHVRAAVACGGQGSMTGRSTSWIDPLRAGRTGDTMSTLRLGLVQ